MADTGCDLVQRAALAAAGAGRTCIWSSAAWTLRRPLHTCIHRQRKGQEQASWSSPPRRFTPGQPSEPETGALIAPIFQTSTYEQDEPGVNRGFDYSRTNNPTRARLEAVLAELEGVAVLRHVRLGPRRRERGAPGAT